MIVSVLPGRVRLRLPAGEQKDKTGTLRAELARTAAEVRVGHNPRSGGLLVTWKPGPKRDAAVMRILESHVPAGRQPSQAPLCMPSMKTVKKGMSVSLAAALLALACRSERAHMWAGGMFAVFLSRHLYVYRKRLFK